MRERAPDVATVAPPRRGVTVAVGAAVTLLAAGLAVLLLGVTGQLVASELFDAGVVVRYGLPAVRVVHDLAAALTVGTLVAATWLVGPDPRDETADPAAALGGAQERLTRIGSIAALTWFVAGALVVLLTAADVSGQPMSTPGFGTIVVSFVFQIDLGRALGVSVLLAGLVATMAWSAIRLAAVGAAAVLSIIAVLPLSLAGHSATSSNHMLSVDSLAFHLVGVCLWIGGLAAVLLVVGQLSGRQASVISRYSTMAGGCFAVVAASGVVNALLRLGSPSQLGSTYGLLVIGKVAALILLGVAGALHRRWTIRQIDRYPGWFVRLAGAELATMALTTGLAVGLSRSAPPAEAQEADPIAALLGFPMPPALSPMTYLVTAWPSLLWLVVAVGAAGGYLVWVIRLRRRGDTWPVPRTAAWLLGCVLLIAATSGGIGVYASIHFSTHLVQHLIVMLGVPLAWVLGSPVTLARRAWRPRTDGSLGAAETLAHLERSTAVGLLSHPVISAIVLLGGLLVFYRTRLFELAVSTHTGHVLMTTYFLAAGALFVRGLLDATRSTRATRITVVVGTWVVLVGFGLTTRLSTTVLAADWWHQLGLGDGAALLADQRLGGLITMVGGSALVLALALAMINDARNASRSLTPTRTDQP